MVGKLINANIRGNVLYVCTRTRLRMYNVQCANKASYETFHGLEPSPHFDEALQLLVSMTNNMYKYN